MKIFCILNGNLNDKIIISQIDTNKFNIQSTYGSVDLNIPITSPNGYKAIGCYFVGFEGSYRGVLSCFDCKLTSPTNAYCGIAKNINQPLVGDNYGKINIIFEKI